MYNTVSGMSAASSSAITQRRPCGESRTADELIIFWAEDQMAKASGVSSAPESPGAVGRGAMPGPDLGTDAR